MPRSEVFCGTCMDLIIYQMMQLQVVHVTDRYRAVEVLACSSVTKSYLTVSGDRNALPECSVSFILIEILHNIRCKDVFIFLTEFLKVFRINVIVGKLQSILTMPFRSGTEAACPVCQRKPSFCGACWRPGRWQIPARGKPFGRCPGGNCTSSPLPAAV